MLRGLGRGWGCGGSRGGVAIGFGDLFFVMLRFVFVLFNGTHSRNRRIFVCWAIDASGFYGCKTNACVARVGVWGDEVPPQKRAASERALARYLRGRADK